jgi:hypothetical protein
MGQPYARGRFYHLYLNGMYWGLYQTEERPESNYAESYFGGSDVDYDVIKVSVEGWPYFNEATDGTMAPWQDLWYKCGRGFASNADYFALEGKDQFGKPLKNTRVYVDIDNLIDYMLVIFYTGNFDAPVSAWHSNNMPNNYYAIFNRGNKGKGFVFIAHDSEHSMFIDPIYVTSGLYENRVTIDDPAMNATGPVDLQPQWLHKRLLDNAEYRMRFADRAYRHFAAGGVFSAAECIARFRSRMEQIDTAIIAESARWGDSKTTKPRNKIDDWVPEYTAIRDNYFPYRPAIVISQLRTAGLYTSLEPPAFRESGTSVTGNHTFSSPVTISLVNPNLSGRIYYSTDGTDPRLIGGTVSPSAQTADNNFLMTISKTTVLKARIVDGSSWSALAELSFSAANEDFSGLKVTEVHYHPADQISGNDTIDGKDLEFIELKNTGSSSVNISGVTVDSAVYYTAPAGAIIPPKGFYVIASKPSIFYGYYGMNPSGNFKGNLSNAGEFVLINDSYSNKIMSFTYSDDYPWPLSADGDGNSLVAVTSMPVGDPNDYRYWKSSIKIGGSPFADDEISTSAETPKEERERGKLTVYPNPASDLLRIHIEDQISGEILLSLTDLKGETVLVRNLENDSELSLSEAGLASGIYIITAEYQGVIRRAIVVYSPGR